MMVAPAGGGERRRLAAILAADVVGYSRDLARDEAGTLARVRRLQRETLTPALAAHGGRLFKTMGDGFLAEFPSAVEAVSSAVEVQWRLGGPGAMRTDDGQAGLAVRIGVAVGDVVVGGDGDVHGDAVNLAARLEAVAEPGSIVVSRTVHEQLSGRLPLPFEDRGERMLKNIPVPVRLFALPAPAIAALPPPGARVGGGQVPPARHGRRALFAAGGLAALATVVGATAWWLVSRPTPPSSPTADGGGKPSSAPPPAATAEADRSARRMSIVVLPFANLSGDPAQDYIADGITDDVIAAVGRITGSLVIGRGTSFAYKGRSVDARHVGRELNVRYVIEGSVRLIGERLHVSTHLVDAASGALVAGDVFAVAFGELASVSRATALRVANTLGNRLPGHEADRAAAERPANPDSLDFLLRGRALFSAVGTPDSYGEVRRLFERAVALDPGSAAAHVWLAHILTGLWSMGRPGHAEDLLRSAEEHLERALAIDSQNARAVYVRGVIDEARRHYDVALAAFDRANEINPNWPFVHNRRGWVLAYLDRPEEAAADFRQAIAISPREPGIGGWHNGLAFTSLMLGRDAEAVGHATRAAAANPGFHWAQLLLAAGLALVGRETEARAALATLRKLRPDVTVANLRRDARARSDRPLWLATNDRIAKALGAMGLPEE